MRCPHDSVSSDVCSLCQARHERLMADPMSKAERAAVVRYLHRGGYIAAAKEIMAGDHHKEPTT